MCHEQWALHADIKREFFYRYIYYNNHWFFWLIFLLFFVLVSKGRKVKKGYATVYYCFK